MTFQYLLFSLVLVHVILTVTQVNGVFYYVAPNVTDCPTNAPCNTLSYYAKSSTLELTNSVLYFMPGTHRLQQIWVIENASNLTLTGPSPDSDLDQDAVVECTTSNRDSGIVVTESSHRLLKSWVK